MGVYILLGVLGLIFGSVLILTLLSALFLRVAGLGKVTEEGEEERKGRMFESPVELLNPLESLGEVQALEAAEGKGQDEEAGKAVDENDANGHGRATSD